MTMLSKSPVTPDALTWIGLAINIIAAWVIATGRLIIGGILVLGVAGLFDILDGALARFTKKTTIFGGLLDSTFDRLSEAAIFIGLLILYAPTGDALMVAMIFLAMVGSFVTSYIRARAEGLGLACSIGLFTRAERVIILCLGLFFDQILIALAILVVLSFVTVGQRLFHVWSQTRTKKQ
ncbi:MAG: CDP-alcohol phosphatidyltransferase family protein [Chloroflexi bacterium]|nr:CDP-alcohol phosphatidyltransferase family protein [Chloroflexota bacterium]